MKCKRLGRSPNEHTSFAGGACCRCDASRVRSGGWSDGAALSLPCHESGMGPVGLMVAGPAMSGRPIISLGLAIEPVLQPR